MTKKKLREIGAKLRTLRGKQSLLEVAERGGLTPSGLCRIESGESEPKLSTFLALAKGLGLTTTELIKEIGA
ncbi:MAG: XRE family transcriptional regulator [Hyphomicrobiaceae bacterium]|nr:MAG: XRE family transcriptional regulator [Hyphomicrobiaceae bacterium]